MIQLKIKDKSYTYDVYHITKAFVPGEQIEQIVCPDFAHMVMVNMGNERVLYIEEAEVASFSEKKERKSYVNKKVYQWLKNLLKKELAWGILTGIRPTKIAMEWLEAGATDREVLEKYRDKYKVTDRKATLGLAIAKREKTLLEQLDYANGYSLYVGIPFCPNTCAYCSFTSFPIVEWKGRVDAYLTALCKEISAVGEHFKDKKLNTIYMGGGTPTTLEAGQLDRLLTHLEETFSYEDLKEITVEAGRPDSITEEKLKVLLHHGVGRISINPQTMQQGTLDLIGRHHTVEDVKRTYAMARKLGFVNINMDLIAGLPGETLEDMKDTLEQIRALNPDSITVHALALKRASQFGQEWRNNLLNNEIHGDQVQKAGRLSDMIDMAATYTEQMGMVPYYLYRQKNIAGNFENVGYAKSDKAGIYNILIMEEKQSIVAVGAGASTKAVYRKDSPHYDEGRQIVRGENVKDVLQYIERIDEMIERKGELLWH